MKYSELNKLSPQELSNKLLEQQQEINKLHFSHAINPLEKPMVIPNTRKTIARIKTLQNERQRTTQQNKK